jgi:hypothetical protein
MVKSKKDLLTCNSTMDLSPKKSIKTTINPKKT